MSECTHETVSFAAFLEYRARRLAKPVVAPGPPPEVATAQRDSPQPESEPIAVAAMLPWPVRV